LTGNLAYPLLPSRFHSFGQEDSPMLCFCAALLLAAQPPSKANAPVPNDLAPPAMLLAAGKPIDVDVGHAAPCLADLKGDGSVYLLVGQFGGGKVRAYPNTGSKSQPRFDRFEWLHADGALASVPAS
jgi:hypothetical protein